MTRVRRYAALTVAVAAVLCAVGVAIGEAVYRAWDAREDVW